MQRRPQAPPRSGCPISIALEMFGDPWSLLIVRDLMFKGLRTFTEFQSAGEGIATNILSDRLARLEDAGILTRSRDPADSRRVRYGLTRKGVDLAPILVELVVWSAQYEKTEAPPQIVRKMRTQRRQVIARLQKNWTLT
jgi:DNA-binding HxlR family transcriptional regulator